MRPTPKTGVQLVTEAKQRIENLTPDQLASELERDDVLLVDLRKQTSGPTMAPSTAPRGIFRRPDQR